MLYFQSKLTLIGEIIMKKELVPTIFTSDGETFLRLEYFNKEELVARITIKIDKDEEENAKQFFKIYNNS